MSRSNDPANFFQHVVVVGRELAKVAQVLDRLLPLTLSPEQSRRLSKYKCSQGQSTSRDQLHGHGNAECDHAIDPYVLLDPVVDPKADQRAEGNVSHASLNLQAVECTDPTW